MDALAVKVNQPEGIHWDTEKNIIHFNIGAKMIGHNRRMVVAVNQRGKIEMHIEQVDSKKASNGS